MTNNGTPPSDFTSDPTSHKAWCCAKAQEALDDPRPAIAAEDVEAHFTELRAKAKAKRMLWEGGQA